jgi:exodeoxyribonuclease-3
MALTFATWNLLHGDKVGSSRSSFDEEFRPDVAAFQETAMGDTDEWAGDSPRKGLSFFTRLPYERASAEEHASPSIPIRIAESDLGAFNVLAVWAKKPKVGSGTYLDDVMLTLDAYRSFLHERPSVILGDFNLCSRIVGQGQANFRAMNDRMNGEFGCVSAYHSHTREAFGKETADTLYLHKDRSKAFHCDLIYIPQGWQDRITQVTVPGHERFTESDHRPVVCKIC